MSSAPHHNDSTIVKNINGTSDDWYTSNLLPAFEKCNIIIRFKIDGLHKKFIAAGGTDSAMCQVKGCSNPGAATAHVIKTDGRSSNNWCTNFIFLLPFFFVIWRV